MCRATPGGTVNYDGDTAIEGVPGTAAPIHLAFVNAAGAKTGKLFPTGSPRDVIGGVEMSCVDAAMPIMAVKAVDLGKTGYESPAEFLADKGFMTRLESLRQEAGARMGIANATDLVIPKPVLVAWPLMVDAARESFLADKVHVFPEYSRGVRTLGRLASHAEAIEEPRQIGHRECRALA